MAEIGIISIGQLAKTSRGALEQLLGHAVGQKLTSLAWNRDPREIETHRRARSAGAQSAPSRSLPPADYLAVSGGSDNGAFAAGLLVGWSDSGTRPSFKLVTGISTGALVAPFLFRVGPRSAAIGTPTSGVLADDFSDLLLFWPGSCFGADSQAAPMGVAAVVRSRRLAVVDRELDCGEDQREQDRDDRSRDRVDVHLRASPLGAPSWSELSAAPPDAFRVLPAATLQLPSIAWRGRRESL